MAVALSSSMCHFVEQRGAYLSVAGMGVHVDSDLALWCVAVARGMVNLLNGDLIGGQPAASVKTVVPSK
jgi:hypothetical protein